MCSCDGFVFIGCRNKQNRLSLRENSNKCSLFLLHQLTKSIPCNFSNTLQLLLSFRIFNVNRAYILSYFFLKNGIKKYIFCNCFAVIIYSTVHKSKCFQALVSFETKPFQPMIVYNYNSDRVSSISSKFDMITVSD